MDAYWNWETSQIDRHSNLPTLKSIDEDQEEDIDNEFATRGYRPLFNIL